MCGNARTVHCAVANSYQYSLKLQPWRKPLLGVFDALELASTCGVTRPTERSTSHNPGADRDAARGKFEGGYFVDPANGCDDDGCRCGKSRGHATGAGLDCGSSAAPFRTVARALAASRQSTSAALAPHARKPIVLKAGIHFLAETITLGKQDSGLTITADPAAAAGTVIVSGGIPLNATWTKSTRTTKYNVWETPVPTSIQAIPGLTTLKSHRRVTRAREPSAQPDQGAELCTDCWHNGVKRWHKDLSCVGKAAVVYKDLRVCDDDKKLPDGQPCKNDSAMWDTYNTYSNGHGGCCASWPGDASPYGPMGNYFCGNASAGGWVGFNDPRGNPGDQGYNGSQGLSAQLPYGFDFDPANAQRGGSFLATMQDPKGAIVHAWRAQGWFVNMFEVESSDPAGAVNFATWKDKDGLPHPKGGWQGGRGWQINASAKDDPAGNYLLAGKWMIENVFEALDVPNEWFFDAGKHTLYVIPNATSGGAPTEQYVAVQLEQLIAIKGSKDSPVTGISITGITFRDAADIAMKPWGVPSGGDWGLCRSGAIFIEGAEGVTVANNVFTRLDGNGVFLSGYTRDTLIDSNEFVWIAMSWGYTNENDGMDGLQPRWTNITRNYVHEFGHYQKQSSMWFQAKACLTHVEGNIVYNGPRAGINFNDGFGGGTNVSHNLIFNQCRESGDHGALNAWDRTAYISDVKYGTPSYEARMNNVNNNFVIANYGASQGFDTDDGSSWYDIHDNFFFMADAWKMDYGGHDSVFTGNVIYHGHNDGQNCVNTWPFLPGHGAVYKGNKCILPNSNNIGNVGDGIVPGCSCPGPTHIQPWDPSNTVDTWRAECGIDFSENEYYTGNVSGTYVNCNCIVDPPGSNNCGSERGAVNPTFAEWQGTHGNDKGSTLSQLPTDEVLLEWAREKLGM